MNADTLADDGQFTVTLGHFRLRSCRARRLQLSNAIGPVGDEPIDKVAGQ